jgi:hypothetical protein
MRESKCNVSSGDDISLTLQAVIKISNWLQLEVTESWDHSAYREVGIRRVAWSLYQICTAVREEGSFSRVYFKLATVLRNRPAV